MFVLQAWREESISTQAAGEVRLVVRDSFVVVHSSSQCLQMPDDRRGGESVRGGHVQRFSVHRRKYPAALLLLPPSPLQLMQCCMHRYSWGHARLNTPRFAHLCTSESSLSKEGHNFMAPGRFRCICCSFSAFVNLLTARKCLICEISSVLWCNHSDVWRKKTHS